MKKALNYDISYMEYPFKGEIIHVMKDDDNLFRTITWNGKDFIVYLCINKKPIEKYKIKLGGSPIFKEVYNIIKKELYTYQEIKLRTQYGYAIVPTDWNLSGKSRECYTIETEENFFNKMNFDMIEFAFDLKFKF
jgi:hypothetical protein